MSDLKTIGKAVTRIDAVEKATGRAKYGIDFKMPGMLHAKVLRSPHAHASITRLDVSKAEKLFGLRAVLTSEDVPAVPMSPLLGDQLVLYKDHTVRCVGEPIAAVAADSIEIAEEAIRLIKVEYEELPAVFDGLEAFRKAPPVIVHPDLPKYKALTSMPIRLDPERPNVCQTYRIRKGDVEKGFKEADFIVENRFTTARIQHCQLESHLAVAWFEPDNSLSVVSSSKEPFEIRGKLSELFNLSPSRVRMLQSYIGGEFGGKGPVRAEAIASLLAHKSRMPVRLVYTREEMFAFGANRVPFTVDIKDGVKYDGTLIAREMRLILSIGAYSEHGVLLARRACAGAVGTYRSEHFKLDSYAVYANLPITGAFRGFGCPEVEWPIEQQMDIIARKLEMDPVKVRERNILSKGERDSTGMVVNSIGVKECMGMVTNWIDWDKRPEQEEGPWKKGKGIAIGNKSVMTGSTSVVIVKVWADGIIEVRHSACQVGQGIKTTLAQIAAEEFAVPVECVKVVSGDTAFCPFDFGTVASRSLVHNGNALITACRDAKQQLFEMAAQEIEAEPEDLTISDGKIFVKGSPDRSMGLHELFNPLGVPLQGGEILGRGPYTSPMQPEDPETGQSERSVFDYSYTANAVEVAVNVDTGEIKLLRSGMACDVGKAINPKIVEGQMEGGIGMGSGVAIHEEAVFDDKGAVVNTGFLDYHINSTLDMPRCSNTKTMIVEAREPEGPFGAKGMGELPLVATAPAIANAVYNAVGVRIKDLPLSKEKVLAEIKKIKQSHKRSGGN